MNKQNPNKQLATLFGLAATVCLAPLYAEETQISEDEMMDGQLPPYVVVATRTPLGLDRVSPSVDFISSDEIPQWQARNLVDLIKQKPGMVVIESGATGAQTSLFTRGTESNHTAFFLDGRRMNVGFGNQYDLSNISIGNVDNVQVQRGASSVNYGSSGIGGVIDVQLQSALDQDGASGSLEAEGGSNHFRRSAFTASVYEDRFGLSVSGSAIATDNERKNDAYEALNWTSRFDYRLTNEWSLELLGQYTETAKELPNSIISPTLKDEQETETWLLSPGIRYATDTLTVHFFYSRSESQVDLFQIESAFAPFPSFAYLGDFPISNTIAVVSDELNLQADYSVSDDLLVSAGLNYRNDEARNTNLNTFSPLDPAVPYAEVFEQFGVYAHALWILGYIELRGGLRADRYTDFDNEVTSSFEFVYNLTATEAAWFLKVATSYAPPGAADLAYDYDPSSPLNAEQSKSYELGLRQALLDGDFVYSIALFRNEIEDLLSFDPYTYDTFNIEDAVTEGAELSAEYAVTKKLKLGLGYTYLVAEADRLNDPRTFGVDPKAGVRLARRPKHLLQLSADYQFTDSLRGGLQAIGHFDREDVDPVSFLQVDAEDYFVIRLVVDWSVNDQLTLFARVENLLDETYAPAAGFPALGRAGYLGARWAF